jgi:hypothetical protein
MQPEMRELFENHGFQVVDNPAAFRLVGANTLLFSGCVRFETVLDGLKDQPVADVPIFIGNDLAAGADIVGKFAQFIWYFGPGSTKSS